MINLLPMSYRRQQIVRKRVVQWTSVVCAVLFVGWSWHQFEYREALALSQQLESLEREYRPHKTMFAQLVSMRQNLEELQQQEAVASKLEYQRNALTVLGVISETAEATKGRVRVTKVEVVGFQNAQEDVQPAVGDMPTSGLVVSGVSLDNPGVAELVDGLKEAGIFSTVELLSSKERAAGEASMQDYAVRCTF
jgi:hypothetical protein